MTENYQDDTLRIFSLNANRPLAEKIAASVGTELGKAPCANLVMAKFKLILKKVFVAIMSTSSSNECSCK